MIYVFDSHAQNNFGMPDPNGTTVVMKCDDVSQLEQYLCSLSVQLNVECFEVVPVEFYAPGITYYYTHQSSFLLLLLLFL